MAERQVRVYSRFNRLWHWSQALSIFLLFFTGLRIMGLHAAMPYALAVLVHTGTALALLLLWVFAGFWFLTTDGWKHFKPTSRGLWDVARFYAWGVFQGDAHPYRKVLRRRHNPLQRLAYLALVVVIFPVVWISGLIYMGHTFWDHLDGAGTALQIVANIHILAAFAVISFVVLHVYLLTIGHGFREHVRPMITGFEKVDLTPEQEALLEKEQPELILPAG